MSKKKRPAVTPKTVSLPADTLSEEDVNPTSPPPAAIPDWSPETLEVLKKLTPLESAFVQWFCTGLSAAEAYIKATSDKPDKHRYAKQYAHSIRHRTHVEEAITLGLKDRQFGARFDREWQFQKLGMIVTRCENLDTPQAFGTMVKTIKLIATLQGELATQSASKVSPRDAERAREFRERLDALIENTRREIDASGEVEKAAKRAAAERESTTPTSPAQAIPPAPGPATP